MDDSKRLLKGSDKRDLFKRKHKDLNPLYYALDLDFILVTKYPPGIIAILDFKSSSDKITFSEVLAYNDLLRHYKIFIIESPDPENGPFIIKQYLGGDFHPEPPTVLLPIIKKVNNWKEFEKWEQSIRIEYAHNPNIAH